MNQRCTNTVSSPNPSYQVLWIKVANLPPRKVNFQPINLQYLGRCDSQGHFQKLHFQKQHLRKNTLNKFSFKKYLRKVFSGNICDATQVSSTRWFLRSLVTSCSRCTAKLFPVDTIHQAGFVCSPKFPSSCQFFQPYFCHRAHCCNR